MGCINNNRKFIKTRLYDDLQGLPVDERNHKYQSEVRLEITELLKKCYPNNFLELTNFYDESFKSFIGLYEADILLLNLFLEKDFIHLSNKLMKSGALNGIKNSKLSLLSSKLLGFLNIQFSSNSIISDEDENSFTRNNFMELIPEISNSDWVPEKNNNPIIGKFIIWFDTNLHEREFDEVFMAYILLVKLWNNDSLFTNENFTTKAIVFYAKINQIIKDKLNKMNSDGYVEFIINTKKRCSILFSDINYMPFLDESESYKHNDSYIKHRSENKSLYLSAVELSEISSDYSFIKLVQSVSEESANYINCKYEQSMIDKIAQYKTPSSEEIEVINSFPSNPKTDKIRDMLYRKLYLFEN